LTIGSRKYVLIINSIILKQLSLRKGGKYKKKS